MWKYMVQPVRLQMKILSIRIACWMTRATDTHSEHVIFIAFPRQQWFRERAEILRLKVHWPYCFM